MENSLTRYKARRNLFPLVRAKRITQDVLADELGVSQPTVSGILRGDRNTSRANAEIIAAHVEVPVDELFERWQLVEVGRPMVLVDVTAPTS